MRSSNFAPFLGPNVADWPLSSVALTQQIGSDRSNSGHAVNVAATQMTDAVEKGKNDLTENFPCEPVETSIRECSGL
jgi:hypothetical protein